MKCESIHNNNILINDTRLITDFKITTYSNYNKAQVKIKLIKAILENDIESACFWSAEYICAGQYLYLWNIIIDIVSKHINIASPLLAIYIDKRVQNFKQLVESNNNSNILDLRNNESIRVLFGEIIIILCKSSKQPTIQSIKINKSTDYSINHISNISKADSVEYIQSVFKEGDPQYLFVALNEFAYNISLKVKDSYKACYWIEWVINAKTKTKNNSYKRNFIDISDKYKSDAIWIIWEIIILTSKYHNITIQSIIRSLLSIFCLHYSHSVPKKRKFILYYAVELLCKPIDLTKPVWKSKEEINTILEKINNIYKDINKNNLDKNSTSNNSNIKSENNIDIKNYNNSNNIREKTKDTTKLTKKMEKINLFFNMSNSIIKKQ